jgi:hypothetical protein
MLDKYQYAMASGRYFCLQQNPVRLFWYLCRYSPSLELHTGSTRHQIYKIIGRLILYKLRLPPSIDQLNLPFYGNVCLPVHRGFKIFDFHRKTVLKIMAADCDDAVVSNEIETLRQTGGLDFAPRILQWNLKERWYTEDFVIGCPFYANPRVKTNVFLKIFQRQVAPCLEEMILWQQPLVVGIDKYVNQLSKKIAERRTDVAAINDSKTDRIAEFVNANASCILKNANGKISLVFSHGDFSLVNILNTANGIKVIDWEGAAKRNPLYDLYNYFLTESYYGRPPAKMDTEISKGIKLLQARLVITSPEIAATLTASSDIYRWLYYLERIGMLLERDLNSKILEVILRSIHVFDAYEENFAKS